MKKRLLICDIDGVVCDCSDRQKKYCDLDAYNSGDWFRWEQSMQGFNGTTEGDRLIISGKEILLSLMEGLRIDRVIFLTAREVHGKELTLAWLQSNVGDWISGDDLYMRPPFDGVRISSADMKKSVVEELLSSHEICLAIDDSPSICSMYSSLGVANICISHPGIDCLTPAGDQRMLRYG